ncbi:MAG: hypothetical protein LBT53_10335 [Puniceicoccales bacterium]|nr:hypothetical protein [Puniceicoccales bacterium]
MARAAKMNNDTAHSNAQKPASPPVASSAPSAKRVLLWFAGILISGNILVVAWLLTRQDPAAQTPKNTPATDVSAVAATGDGSTPSSGTSASMSATSSAAPAVRAATSGDSAVSPPPSATPAAAPAAAFPVAPPLTPSRAAVRVSAANLLPTPPTKLEKFHIREERRDLDFSTTLADLGKRFQTEPVVEMDFPLFDGRVVRLTQFTYESVAPNEGVFYAKIFGEPGGGDVQLSYVNSAFSGRVHLPSRDEYYSIRFGGSDNGVTRSFLTQEDPKLMPVCGTCAAGGTAKTPKIKK